MMQLDQMRALFLHDPLHDYESVWQMAVWFALRRRPDGVVDHVMGGARCEVSKNRIATPGFGPGLFHLAVRCYRQHSNPLANFWR